MKELMDRLGILIPSFTGKPWWTDSDSETEYPAKKEEMEEYEEKHELSHETCEELPVKRLKQDFEKDPHDNNDP